MIEKLPNELKLHLFSFFNRAELNSVRRVCKDFNALLTDNFFLNKLPWPEFDLEYMDEHMNALGYFTNIIQLSETFLILAAHRITVGMDLTTGKITYFSASATAMAKITEDEFVVGTPDGKLINYLYRDNTWTQNSTIKTDEKTEIRFIFHLHEQYITGFNNGNIIAFNKNGQSKKVVGKHTNRVVFDFLYGIQLDNNCIATHRTNSTNVRIWDLTNPNHHYSLETGVEVYTLCKLNNHQIAVGSKHNEIFIWDLDQKIVVKKIRGSSEYLLAINSTLLLAGNFLPHGWPRLAILDINSGKQIKYFSEFDTSNIYALHQLNDKRLLISHNDGHNGKTLRLATLIYKSKFTNAQKEIESPKHSNFL